MMRFPALMATILVVLFLLGSCENTTTPEKGTEPVKTELKPSLAAYSDTLNKLDKRVPGSIDRALQLYGMLAPHDSTSADSAASALMTFINSVVKIENDSLLRDTTNYRPLIDPTNQTLSPKQQSLLSNLHANKLKMVPDGEGGAYLVPAYETILTAIVERTSRPVDTYLSLMAKEDTTPVFRDAGLAIELTELMDRLVISEQLITQKLPEQFKAETVRLNTFYTQAALMGSDNSPVLDFGSTTLNDSFKKGYDYLLAKYPGSKAAATVSVWLTVAATGDQTKIDAYRRTLR